jgi:phasin family protein
MQHIEALPVWARRSTSSSTTRSNAMYVTPEQIQAVSKAGSEAVLAVATAQFAAFEKLASLNASAVKQAFEDSVSQTRALLGVKDLQELAGLQNSAATPAVERAMAYSKSLYEVVTQANANLTKVAEKQAAEWNENFTSALDKLSKNAPAGSDVAFTAVKSALAAANTAYDSFSKVTRQATELADANIAAASETAKGLNRVKKVA